MKTSHFFAGFLLGGAAAIALWPDATEESELSQLPIASTPLRRASIADLLADCRSATNKGEIYRTREALGRIKSREMPEALRLSIETNPSARLSEETRCLIAHWASQDPEAALAWSWENLRDSRKWETAAEQIFETWIASGDPAVLVFLKETTVREEALTKEEVGEEMALFLSQGQMRKIREWLYFYDANIAKAAFDQAIMPVGEVTFADRLPTQKAVIEALKNWEGTGKNFHVRAALLDRGTALGMSFASAKTPQKSGGDRFVGGENTDRDFLNEIYFQDLARNDLSAAFLKAAKLDPKERHGAYLTIYDEWSRAHPVEQVDLNTIPVAARNMWRDLSLLGPPDRK